jgi:serine/threonine protein kinase
MSELYRRVISCVTPTYIVNASLQGAVREALKLKLSWSLKVRIAQDIAQALACLALHGVIHRDIKTTNVVLDDAWRAKICDFNLAIDNTSLAKHSHAAGELLAFDLCVTSHHVMLTRVLTCHTSVIALSLRHY